ncbi:unnamed protein product [Callosobruchus maculatus]|uniref:Uncharacterized protein n=1 Tax=Callosobruchus maculatus TaxID=64391 RepID=A0A653BLJ4_CALMS|nr:unnamed protein product [Callosobruchus maculatus]
MGGIRNSQHSPPRPHFKSIYASSICLFISPSFRGIQKYGEYKRQNQRHFGSFRMLWSRHILVSFVMATRTC